MRSDSRWFDKAAKDSKLKIGDWATCEPLDSKHFKAGQVSNIYYDLDCEWSVAVIPNYCAQRPCYLTKLILRDTPRLFPEEYDLDELCEVDLI